MVAGTEAKLERFPDDGGPLFLWDREGEGPRRTGMVCFTSICDNPDCRVVHVHGAATDDRLRQVEQGPEGISLTFRRPRELDEPLPTASFGASVNIDSGEIKARTAVPEGSPAARLLEGFRAHLPEPLLEILQRRWRRVRNLTDRTSWRRRDWSWWEPGVMVGWAEVFPDDEDFLLSRGKRSYWALDQYCVTPDCTCREMAVSFHGLPSKGTPQRAGAVHANIDTWKPTQVRPESESPEALRKLWKKLLALPGFCEAVRHRHREAKKVGGELFRKAPPIRGAVEPLRRNKVGRNDPCPCGSGKKYKRCCLRAR